MNLRYQQPVLRSTFPHDWRVHRAQENIGRRANQQLPHLTPYVAPPVQDNPYIPTYMHPQVTGTVAPPSPPYQPPQKPPPSNKLFALPATDFCHSIVKHMMDPLIVVTRGQWQFKDVLNGSNKTIQDPPTLSQYVKDGKNTLFYQKVLGFCNRGKIVTAKVAMRLII